MPKPTHSGTESLKITRQSFNEILGTIGTLPVERGGPLGGAYDDWTVRHFLLDHSAERSWASYSPDYKKLNKIFKEDWNPKGIRLLGFVHSHPRGVLHPSGGDVEYATKILAAIPELSELLLPIVMSTVGGQPFQFLPFVARRDGSGGVSIKELGLEIVDEPTTDLTDSELYDATGTFDRVVDTYDLPRLSGTRLVIVGVGGAAGLADDLSRCGIGQFVLIDPDKVSKSNLATQQTYVSDLSRHKVDAVSRRIRNINPDILVATYPRKLEEIDDSEFKRLCFGEIERSKPHRTIILGLTDSFPAQARINRLALNLGLPSLCAQIYKEGRAAEVTFTYPGLTPACHRCVLSPRYRAFQEGIQHDVTSVGSPIFATTRVNAISGFILLALAHYDDHRSMQGETANPPGTNGPPSPLAGQRFALLLPRIATRNLVQIRMDPDLSETLGMKVFDRVLQSSTEPTRIFFDESLWQPQILWSSPERQCPDCGATGDLRDSIGRFKDTRTMVN